MSGGDDGDPAEGAGPVPPAGAPGRGVGPDSSEDLASDLELGHDDTRGSGTRPEGQTRRDALDKRPGESTPSGDPLIGRVLLDRYRVERRIGAGGMGSVYVGEQIAVGREVALKVLRSDLLSNEHVRQRFRREAEVIGRLSHPNTIQLIDYGETVEGLAIMVTELLRGAPLNERLKDEGPMDLGEVLELGLGVAASLAEAHAQGLVHRDLKPANIFLTKVAERSFPKVLDFGIARLLDEEATRLTTTGQVFGTPRYMSPEQAISTAAVDARSDIYSLGLILFECLVGQPPFVAQTSLQYLSAHSQQTPPKLRERYPAAPAKLEALIDACLEKDPDRRPPTAVALGEALAEIQRELGGAPDTRRDPAQTWTGIGDVGTRPPEPAEPLEVPGARRGRGLLALGLLAALIGGIAWAVGRFGGGGAPIRLDAGAPLVVAALGGDAGAAVDLGARPATAIDAGAEDPAPALDTPDSGTDVAAPPPLERPDAGPADAGARAPPDPDPDPDPPPRRRRDAGGGASPPVGTGVVTGPRGLVIDLPGADDGPDLAELAERCVRSKWRGRARLEVRGCPRGCAIIVDEICAGRTPAEDRALGPGRRDVAVVCEGRVVRAATLRFESGASTRFSCR